MEHSSPLAAVQPPSMLFGHCFRPDAPTSFPTFGPRSRLGSNSFNFKDLSMKPVHGSSPTASLAADLSQNFHIDQSPQLATPRRSLFSSNLFGHGNTREDMMTTPPLPSSSPIPTMETMDMSPLPHKVPFIRTREIEFNPHTPSGSPMDTSALSPLLESPLMGPKVEKQERRRPNFLRPSLARSKFQSHQLGMAKPAPESQAPPFKFHSRGDKTSNTSTSMEDMFGESPQKERLVTRNSGTLLNNPRSRPPLGSYGSHSRANGSPTAASIRKSTHPMMRPRKQCRRSLSMFEHPEDVIVENEANYTTNAPLQSITDIESTPSLQLPHFIPEDQADTLPRINKTILVELMDGKYNDRFDHIVVIDCRFEYEYEGGHINGAVNFNDKEYLAAELFSNPRPRTALILHCEYSAHRAPIMAKYIRHQDRAFNVDQYPCLTYPDMYILDGGYSAFFGEHRSLCYPQNYVAMNAKEHEYACERGLGKVKQRSKLGRAQTFAFGQQSPQMEDSPTGRYRNDPGERARYLDSPFKGTPTSRGAGRRMLSY